MIPTIIYSQGVKLPDLERFFICRVYLFSACAPRLRRNRSHVRITISHRVAIHHRLCPIVYAARRAHSTGNVIAGVRTVVSENQAKPKATDHSKNDERQTQFRPTHLTILQKEAGDRLTEIKTKPQLNRDLQENTKAKTQTIKLLSFLNATLQISK
jgi:hypothetical protein